METTEEWTLEDGAPLPENPPAEGSTGADEKGDALPPPAPPPAARKTCGGIAVVWLGEWLPVPVVVAHEMPEDSPLLR